MPDYPLELQGFSIVALGTFNPAIFQPVWFSANNLISSEDAKNATIQIIHKNAAIFNTDWFSLQVTADSCSIDTSDPTKSLPVRDLVAGTFRILEHTPLTAFGLNWYGHFRMSSPEVWHAFGHHFAPKESWYAILKEPGLRTLVIEGKREKGEGAISVTVQPSAKIEHGVFILVNEHHNLLEPPDATTADRNRRFLEALQGSWDGFLSYGGQVSKHLLSAFTGPIGRPRTRKRG